MAKNDGGPGAKIIGWFSALTAKDCFVLASVIGLVGGSIVGNLELVTAGIGWAVLAAAISPRVTIILRNRLWLSPDAMLAQEAEDETP